MFASCNYDQNYVKKQFCKSEKLVSEKIFIDTLLSPSFIMIKGSNLFVSSIKTEDMLHVYSLPDLKFLYSTGRKGNGPDEFASFPMFCRSSSNHIYIWGYTPTRIKKFSINTSGNMVLADEISLSHYESFNQMHIIKDSSLVYSAIPSMFSIKKYNLFDGSIENEIKIEEDDHKESFFYSNRGFVAANDSVLIYAYVYKNQIDIHNIADFKLRKSIMGDWTKKRIIVGDFENNDKYYLSVVAGGKYFYALCINNNSLDEQKYDLEVYDYDGNSIIKYTFDIVPFLFDVDEKNGYIYGFNYDNEDYFLRFKIDPVF